MKTMTFDEILNSTSAKIEYLGGLKALIPYIPFSIDEIKEKLRENSELNQTRDTDKWYHIALIPKEEENSIRALLYSKGVTNISSCDIVVILKDAARQIAKLPQEEIDKLCPGQKHRYYVSIAIDGRITIPVFANDPYEAKHKAKNAFMDTNIGDVECISHKAVNAEDIDGNITDY